MTNCLDNENIDNTLICFILVNIYKNRRFKCKKGVI